MKTFEQFLEDTKTIPVDGQYGVKMALKRVKNASAHTKALRKAVPDHKLPHNSSAFAAYSESEVIAEGADIYCPNCGENHGKATEYTANHGGSKTVQFCGTCGYSAKKASPNTQV